MRGTIGMLHRAKSGGRKLERIDQAIALRIAIKYERDFLGSFRRFKRQVSAGIGFKDQNSAAVLLGAAPFRAIRAYRHA